MALSKPTFLTHLKTLAKSPLHYLRRAPPSFVSLRSLSFASPEDAAAERRRRKRRLRIEPPIVNRPQTHKSSPRPISNPNAPKLPEPISVLAGTRLNLHNRILTLIRENDLDEAALFTRHSVYSNCRPTIFTVNAVLNAQLRQSKYSDLLALHRFVTQAAIAPNVITYNILFQTYLDCRKPDMAMEHYKQMINDAPFNPSPTTYRILIKGLVDNGKLDRAMELKEEMAVKGLAPDPFMYHHLMRGHVKNSDADGVFNLFDELKEKLGGGAVDDGIVYGSLMKGYFLKKMEEEAMECYREAVGEGSKVKMSDVGYNSVLDALSSNGKFHEALRLFERMSKEHNPPMRLAVNLGSFNVIVDGYCAQGRFKEAMDVFRKMGDYRCNPDAMSFNNLIEQLCVNGMLGEAEELYGEMGDKGVSLDEFTYALLVDACFGVNKVDEAAGYFRKMVESGLRPNLAFYNKLADGLVKAEKVDEAKSIFDTMVKKLKMDMESYTFIMKALSDDGKLDAMLEVVDTMLDDDGVEFNEEVQEFVKKELAKEGREEELPKLVEEKERQMAEAKAKEAEAAEASKRGAKLAISTLITSKHFGNKEAETETSNSSVMDEVQAKEEEIAEYAPADANDKAA